MMKNYTKEGEKKKKWNKQAHNECVPIKKYEHDDSCHDMILFAMVTTYI